MFPSVKSVKSNAKSALKDNWGIAIAAITVVFFLFGAILVVTDLVPFILNSKIYNIVFLAIKCILLLFFGFPLFYGLLRLFYCIYNSISVKFDDIFFYLSSKKHYKKALNLTLNITVRITIITLVFLLPSFLLTFVAKGGIDSFFQNGVPIWLNNLTIFGAFLRCIAIALIILFSIRYYMAPYILVTHSNSSVKEIIYLSSSVARYTANSFIVLAFSLLGWILLSITCIPALFTLPFIIMCYIVHSKFAINYYNNRFENSRL